METVTPPPDAVIEAAQTPGARPGSRTAEVRGYILFTFAVAIGAALAWELREVLLLVYVSALFAVVLMPVVNSIVRFELREGRHISKGAAIAMLLLSIAIALGLLLALGLPPVIHDMRQFAADLPSRIPDIIGKLRRVPLADQLGIDNVAGKIQNGLSATAEYVVSSSPKWAGRIFDLLTTMVLCVYFMLEGDRAYKYAMSLLAIPDRLRLAVTLEKAEIRMSRWLFGQALLMLILGISSTVVFGFLHVRYFVLLGVLMGLMNIIPIAGGIITITICALVAAIDSWTKMAGVLIFYIIYINIENAFLTPRIMRSSVNLLGLSVLIALLAGTALAGVAGAAVAVPTAALISVLVDEYVVHKDWKEPTIQAPEEDNGQKSEA